MKFLLLLLFLSSLSAPFVAADDHCELCQFVFSKLASKDLTAEELCAAREQERPGRGFVKALNSVASVVGAKVSHCEENVELLLEQSLVARSHLGKAKKALRAHAATSNDMSSGLPCLVSKGGRCSLRQCTFHEVCSMYTDLKDQPFCPKTSKVRVLQTLSPKVAKILPLDEAGNLDLHSTLRRLEKLHDVAGQTPELRVFEEKLQMISELRKEVEEAPLKLEGLVFSKQLTNQVDSNTRSNFLKAIAPVLEKAEKHADGICQQAKRYAHKKPLSTAAADKVIASHLVCAQAWRTLRSSMQDKVQPYLDDMLLGKDKSEVEAKLLSDADGVQEALTERLRLDESELDSARVLAKLEESNEKDWKRQAVHIKSADEKLQAEASNLTSVLDALEDETLEIALPDESDRESLEALIHTPFIF